VKKASPSTLLRATNEEARGRVKKTGFCAPAHPPVAERIRGFEGSSAEVRRAKGAEGSRVPRPGLQQCGPVAESMHNFWV
jgi:hypothetical protein